MSQRCMMTLSFRSKAPRRSAVHFKWVLGLQTPLHDTRRGLSGGGKLRGAVGRSAGRAAYRSQPRLLPPPPPPPG